MAFGTAYMHALVISVQKKGENPTDKCFPSKLEIFAPQKMVPACWVLWRPQCSSNFAGHLLAPPWSLEQDPRAFGTACMGALVISVQKK